jgi:hypothetical protein
MLEYARQRVEQILGLPRLAVLASNGPAGMQVSELPCEALGLSLYLLVPGVSDHLYNLSENPIVTLLTAYWQLTGEAKVVAPEQPVEPNLFGPENPYAGWLDWCVLVHVEVHRVHIRRTAGWGNVETIDLV